MLNLASLLRPKNLDEFVGQEKLVGKGAPLYQAIKKNLVFSMIFWGPPGVGKTTLARIIATSTQRKFYDLSAVSAKKADLREIINYHRQPHQLDNEYLAPVVFLDEIHRFSKAQQDFLLPYVESGEIILIGATTENPSFEVISALLSRLKVFVLEPLKEKEINIIIDRALKLIRQKLKPIKLDPSARKWLVNYSRGDARKLLNLIDQAVTIYGNLKLETLKKTLQTNPLRYDKKADEHYDTISAFIKSMRASDVDATLYYLARMIEGGEDPKFIARRMVIFASEDIGLAVPTALVVANEVFEAVEKVGLPEAQISLAHGAAYLAKCKKSRASYNAYFQALADVKKHGNLPIPLHLRNAPTKLMEDLGYNQGYEMYPDKKKNLLPKKLKGKRYFKD